MAAPTKRAAANRHCLEKAAELSEFGGFFVLSINVSTKSGTNRRRIAD
jgi:hypothetical protein